MTAPFTIRPATPDDAAVIAGFNVALAAETEDHALDPAVVRRGVAALLADPAKGRYFVACPADDPGGEPAGQIMVTREWSDWRNGDFWWVQSVYVAPPARGRGAFRALLGAVADAAGAAGAVGLRLYVERENAAAQGVYARSGFAETPYRVWERS